MNNLKDKKILITGGTGSVGKAIAKLLLQKCSPKEIKILSRSEYHQWQMAREFDGKGNIIYALGDIKNYNAVEIAMEDIDIVIHTAALKHIGRCEENPIEAIKVNIVGSLNIIEAALITKPEKVLAMSTDKACDPINIYGKTKNLMEDIFLSSNNYLLDGPKFSCIRCGNILNSNGSVTEIFREQAIKDKKIKITDPSMTRFWITLPQIAKFIVGSLMVMGGGEIFIPKMGSSDIETLANVFSNDHEIIGAKNGERLHEILFTKKESIYCEVNESCYILRKNAFLKTEWHEYRSNTNNWQLTTADLKRMLNHGCN